MEVVKTPEELKAEYEALIGKASKAIAASEPFKTVTWKNAEPVIAKPSFLDQVKNLFSRS